MCADVSHTFSISLYQIKTMATDMVNVALEYALLLFDEEIINSIIKEELTLEKKKEVLMSLDETKKRNILLKLGFNKAFLKTL